MTSILEEIVPKLRRAIDDTETPYCYQDEALMEYIEDAIDKLIIMGYNHKYTTDRDNHEISPEVTPAEQILFAMQSKLDLLERQPNISFNAGSLSVRRKSDDKVELRKMIKSAINNLQVAKGMGKSSTEFDTFKDQFSDWLYVKSL